MDLNPQKNQEMKIRKSSVLHELFSLFFAKEKTIINAALCAGECEKLLECIRDAKNEWVNAHINFEHAEAQEMVDYYTYKIKASEARYEYFLKKAKEQGIRVEVSDSIGVASGNCQNTCN